MNTDELNNVFNNNSDNNQSPTKLNKNINNNKNIENNNISTSEMNIINELSQNNIKQMCKEHLEPLTYLCLDCMSNCICAECVVHGIHKNHEVLNIKKAYPLIYNKTQEISNHLISRINELNNTKRNIEEKAKEISALNNKCKIDIRQAFDELRNLLNKKEKEIMDKTENNLNDNLNELNTYNQIIKSKIILLNRLNETVNVYLMRKDELNLINFYTENKNKIMAQTELNELNNINNMNISSLSNLKIYIDKSSFDAMISAINTLNFEVNTLKGLDIRNSHSLGKFTAKRNLYGIEALLDNDIIDNNKNIKEKNKKNKKV